MTSRLNQNKPEIAWDVINSEGETIAKCIGTIHIANNQMVINPLLQQTVDSCAKIYLECGPDNIYFLSPKDFSGLKCQFVMDYNIAIKAWIQGKPIIGLDDTELAHNQKKDIESCGLTAYFARVLGMEKLPEYQEVLAGYQKGNPEVMACIKHSLPETQKQLIFYQRESKWLAKLLPELKKVKEKPIAICVGFAHFLGEDGLLTKFKEAGYTVSRIMRPLPDHSKIGKFFKWMRSKL